LAFQYTFKELMVKKEDAIAEREEKRRRDNEATTKSFVDLLERSNAADKAIVKARLFEAGAKTTALETKAMARLLEAKAKTKFLEANSKTKLLEAKAKTKLLEAEAKTKLLKAKAKLMAEENKIVLIELESISDPDRREWFEKMQKMIWEHEA
jgi:hypothetical protein